MTEDGPKLHKPAGPPSQRPAEKVPTAQARALQARLPRELGRGAVEQRQLIGAGSL